MLCGYSTGFCGITNANTLCVLYSLAVIVSVRCPCRPPPRSDATDAAFPLTNRCRSISTSLVGSLSIFGRMGMRNSARTPSTLLVSPAISSRTLVGVDGGFVPWDNLSNLLKARCILTRRHWRVELNG